ncbi:hypothetical protein [Streptomyces sp. NPDC001750]|uniref:hypothetical protein n=1 Tax=Streptomyces sp. NPDC001750 TaxID=3364607 RepID=UPI003692A934
MENTQGITNQTGTEDLTITFTREETALLLPWLRETLTNQEKREGNGGLCQLFSRVMRLSNRQYGTEPFTPDHCICYGD